MPELEHANRRLAQALGGDLACVDAARILRPPASWNHKHSPPASVAVLDIDHERQYELAGLIDGLADPPGARTAVSASRLTVGTELDRQLLAIPAATYVRVLTGATPDRTGKIHCPFHVDATASLQLYDDGTWYCFGACQTGGSIFDFAARAWAMGTRGREFLRLRQRLADVLPPELVSHLKGSWTP
ncbi:MAG: CHC2 zinc finger domain-containing protein [Solirubrobacteraceae bacterium]